jgi:peptidoglycan/xylan/chitin deacetylase (PgdA/CDA1 family)
MNALKFIFYLSFFVSLSLFGQAKQVCFSFDDLPVVNYGTRDTNMEKAIMEKLIVSLTARNVPTIGFVNEKKLYEKDSLIDFQVDLLKKWRDSGLELGNHTFSHIDYHTASFDEYTNDILKGEIVTNELLSEKNTKSKYFRHPFLHIGNTKGKADSLNDFLGNHGYTVAPVTIDNEDYIFARAYQKAKIKNDTNLMAQIGTDYISYMEMKLKYFENESNKLFNRNIKQILLIHASLLNSDYIDSLISMFKRNNYNFISMDEALEDEAYKSEITAFGDWGISWIDRWALSQGKKGDFFKDEPVTPKYITEIAK